MKNLITAFSILLFMGMGSLYAQSNYSLEYIRTQTMGRCVTFKTFYSNGEQITYYHTYHFCKSGQAMYIQGQERRAHPGAQAGYKESRYGGVWEVTAEGGRPIILVSFHNNEQYKLPLTVDASGGLYIAGVEEMTACGAAQCY